MNQKLILFGIIGIAIVGSILVLSTYSDEEYLHVVPKLHIFQNVGDSAWYCNIEGIDAFVGDSPGIFHNLQYGDTKVEIIFGGETFSYKFNKNIGLYDHERSPDIITFKRSELTSNTYPYVLNVFIDDKLIVTKQDLFNIMVQPVDPTPDVDTLHIHFDVIVSGHPYYKAEIDSNSFSKSFSMISNPPSSGNTKVELSILGETYNYVYSHGDPLPYTSSKERVTIDTNLVKEDVVGQTISGIINVYIDSKLVKTKNITLQITE